MEDRRECLFNPTSVAVQASLQDVFDEFGPFVIGHLRMISTADDQSPE